MLLVENTMTITRFLLKIYQTIQHSLHLKYATMCHISFSSVYASSLAYLLPVKAKALVYTPYIDSLATFVSGKTCKAQWKQNLRWEASLPNNLK